MTGQTREWKSLIFLSQSHKPVERQDKQMWYRWDIKNNQSDDWERWDMLNCRKKRNACNNSFNMQIMANLSHRELCSTPKMRYRYRKTSDRICWLPSVQLNFKAGAKMLRPMRLFQRSRCRDSCWLLCLNICNYYKMNILLPYQTVHIEFIKFVFFYHTTFLVFVQTAVLAIIRFRIGVLHWCFIRWR